MRPILHLTVSTLLVLGLTGCASNDRERDQRLATVLNELDTDTEYTSTRRCLSNYDSVEVLDDRHLLFKPATGDDLWLNTLRSRCPGLRRNDTLLFRKTSNRLCNLDSAEVIDRFLFWRRTGPVCSLGEFHQLTENQAALIRQATQSPRSAR
jgi:hypothetical protein